MIVENVNQTINVANKILRTVDSKGRGYGTGRGKKNSVARVWAGYTQESNTITVNGLTCAQYFSNPIIEHMLFNLLSKILGDETCVNIKMTVRGGGKSGQARAAKLGIARALVVLNENLRESLKRDGYLTRDARVSERMKPGQPGARKQYPYNRR